MRRTGSSRTPFLAVLPAAAAIVAAGARWLSQGSGNVYTTMHRRFYVRDRDLGWQVVTDGPIWLGLEVIAVMVAFAAGVAAAAWMIRRVERRRGAACRAARIATWVAASAPLAVPVVAFASGGAPDRAVEILPAGETAAAPTTGIEGDLALPAGTYRVEPGGAITARISAGKETFDARFAGGLEGEWRGAPGDLARPMAATVSVAVASVDTGVALRSEHAREDYLHADRFPRIGFELRRLIAARQDAPDRIAFRAEGAIALMGETIPVELTGTLGVLGRDGAIRLGLAGVPSLVVQADTELRISATPLVADADSFDADRVPIQVSLILANRTATPTE